MKKLFTILFVLCAAFSHAQRGDMQTLPTIASLKMYNGTAAYVFITDSMKMYVPCTLCIVDNIYVFASTTVLGKKWTRDTSDVAKAPLIYPNFKNRVGINMDPLPTSGYNGILRVQGTDFNLPAIILSNTADAVNASTSLIFSGPNISGSSGYAGVFGYLTSSSGSLKAGGLKFKTKSSIASSSLTDRMTINQSGAVTIHGLAGAGGFANLGTDGTFSLASVNVDSVKKKADTVDNATRSWTNTRLMDYALSSAVSLPGHKHDASDVDAGVFDDARLSSNIPRKNGNNNWTSNNSFQQLSTKSIFLYNPSEPMTEINMTAGSKGSVYLTNEDFGYFNLSTYSNNYGDAERDGWNEFELYGVKGNRLIFGTDDPSPSQPAAIINANYDYDAITIDQLGKLRFNQYGVGFFKLDADGNGFVDNTSYATSEALDDKVDKISGKGLSTEDYTTTEKNKLATIASGATANSTDAQLRDRSTHTGTQLGSTISDFQSLVSANSYVANSVAHYGRTDNPHSVTLAQVGYDSAVDHAQLITAINNRATNAKLTDSISALRSILAVVPKRVLYKNTTTNNTGNTSENEIYRDTIKASVFPFGLNTSLDIKMLLNSTSSGNAKTARLKINGTTVAQMVQDATNETTMKFWFWISNRNSLSSQITAGTGASATTGVHGGWSVAGQTPAPTTPALNTAGDVIITITSQLANSGEFQAVEQFEIIQNP